MMDLQERRRELGVRLRLARKIARKTQADVGEELHISRTAVAHWEAGRSEPTATQVMSLAILYGTPTDFLLFGVAVVPVAMIDAIPAGTCEPLDRARATYRATLKALGQKGHDSGMMGLP